jgi:hypothetical protein
MYNTYYEYFEDFKTALLGVLESVSALDPESILGRIFASRIRDKFRSFGVLISDFEFHCVYFDKK